MFFLEAGAITGAGLGIRPAFPDPENKLTKAWFIYNLELGESKEDTAVITNLSPEHIESHGSFAKYREVKGKLFSHLKRCKVKYANDGLKIHKLTSGIKKIELNRIKKIIIANLDDEHAEYFLSFWAERKIGFPCRSGIDKGKEDLPESLEIIRYKNITVDSDKVSFQTLDTKISLKLAGSFNVANVMNAISIARLHVGEIRKIKKAVEEIEGVAGRLEKIDEGQNFIVIVDYAFEPKAMKKIYETIVGLPHKKIIHVFGACGGGRDESRRPKLGKIAGERAETVIVTNEDPYDDDPELIIAQVAAGAETAGKESGRNLFKITDRREAIKKALAVAEKGDLVLITGKGSEQAICAANGEKIPWDDRAVAREELNRIINNKKEEAVY